MTSPNGRRKALIIGAGPAGLTAAFELLKRTDIQPIVLEKSTEIGGISRTVRYKGNRMDIGGHRFFSKSDRVMKWWMEVMPVEGPGGTENITYHHQTRTVSHQPGPDPTDEDRVMLIRNRKSRIYFLRRFFDYPITLSGNTLKNLGLIRTMKIGVSYAASAANQKQPEKTLEDFLINRFGRELYLTFFKSYTEKVWGVPCHEISAEWGAQRIKGLSVVTAIAHLLKKAFAVEETCRYRAEGHRDLAHREVHVSQARSRPALGIRGRMMCRPKAASSRNAGTSRRSTPMGSASPPLKPFTRKPASAALLKPTTSFPPCRSRN